MNIDLDKLKTIHFIGIKGVGMTALALCAKDMGIKVTGSDLSEYFVTDKVLARAGIRWQNGFSSKHIKNPDLVIFTAAHKGEDNIEVKEAKRRAIPVLSHGAALGLFMQAKRGISVAGVGGKTTTSAMLATIFKQAGKKISFCIGAASINKNQFPGEFNLKGEHFIAEADEYFASPQDKTPRFFYQNPQVIILTNVVFDHPDVYKNLASTLRAFTEFLQKVPKNGLIIVPYGKENINKITAYVKAPVKSYGLSSQADWQVKNIKVKNSKLYFDLKAKEGTFNLVLNVPGEFNALNAAACFIAARFFKLSPLVIKKGLGKFKGTKRRFELVEKAGAVKFYDDYAHHPLEIKASLKAARIWFKGSRIIALFQPHTYSRTKALFADFCQSFAQADIIYVAPIYASAREEKDLTVSSKKLTKAIKTKNSGKQVFYVKNEAEFLKSYRKICQPNDVVFTLGAGDIFTWHKSFKKL